MSENIKYLILKLEKQVDIKKLIKLLKKTKKSESKWHDIATILLEAEGQGQANLFNKYAVISPTCEKCGRDLDRNKYCIDCNITWCLTKKTPVSIHKTVLKEHSENDNEEKCNELTKRYLEYLSKDLKEITHEDYCWIELPFPRPIGDSIFVRIDKIEDGYMLSDHGFMIEYLWHYGLNLWKLEGLAGDIFDSLKSRYDIVDEGNDGAIKLVSRPERLMARIFQMSNIMNELSFLRLLATPPKVNVSNDRTETREREQ